MKILSIRPILRQIALAASLGLCALAAVAQEPQGTIQGQVHDASTEEPLIGAAVSVPGTTCGAITDGEGRFEISGLAPVPTACK